MRFLDAFGVGLLLAASGTMLMCSRPSPEASAPSAVAVDVPPMNDGAPLAVSSSQPEDGDRNHPTPTPGSCEGGYVEVLDGNTNAIVARYQLGREIVANVRGAKHPFAEHVIHHNGSIVFHLEAIAQPDSHGGHLNLTIVDFTEPKQFPAVFEPARAEYMPLGHDRESDERTQQVRIEITKYNDVGGFIEGTFAPTFVVPPGLLPSSSAQPAASFFPPPPRPSASFFPPPPRPSASFSPRPLPTPNLPRASASASSSFFPRPPPPPPRASASSSSAAFPRSRPVFTPYKGRFKVCRTADWRVRI